MSSKKPEKQNESRSEDWFTSPTPGIKLLSAIEAHQDFVLAVTFDPSGETLASGGTDGVVKLWQTRTGKLLRTLQGHEGAIFSLAFDCRGETVVSAGSDGTVRFWEAESGEMFRTLEGHHTPVVSVAFDANGETLASGWLDGTVKLWEWRTGKLLHVFHERTIWRTAFDPQGNVLACGGEEVTLWDARSGKLLRKSEKQRGSHITSVAFDPRGDTLACASYDGAIQVWEPKSGKLLRTLEGHTGAVNIIAFSPNGRLLASKSDDHTIRLWDWKRWETIGFIPAQTREHWFIPALAFHPTLPILAAAGSGTNTTGFERCPLIHMWEVDDELLVQSANKTPGSGAVHHTTGKVVLLGDHSVGKSALGHRLIHNRFEKQESTHGQQFWVFPALGKYRADGTECEAILWDFAGQPDYRLVHALFVDNADLALVLFDAADIHDPLHGVGFWLKQLQIVKSRCPIILVGAQIDRGSSALTEEELKAFCRKHRIIGPIPTSAATGAGINELVERMKSLIPWDEKPATVTTTTFKRIKDYVLSLKESKSANQTIVTPEELRTCLQTSDGNWRFTDAEMLTAVGHLENYGYVKRLRTSKGELRILLEPERLNNLASSFVLEARRNPKGLGPWKRSGC